MIKTMKKMYKKPQTEKVNLEPNEVTMQATLGVSNGPHDNLNAAPGRTYSPAPSLENL